MRYSDEGGGMRNAEDPEVVWYGGRFLLFYAIGPPAGAPGVPHRIGIAESADLERWTKLADLAPEGDLERRGIVPGSLIVRDGALHLFYYTYGNGVGDSVCHAVSRDGIRFERDPTNPVFRAQGDWTCGRAILPSVVLAGDRLRMYCCTRDADMAVQSIVLAETPWDSGFARDEWRQFGHGPVFGPELGWEFNSTESPTVARTADGFVMFYGGGYWSMPQQIGCATSRDGYEWTRLGDAPFLPTQHDAAGRVVEQVSPSVFVDPQGGWHLFTQVTDDDGRSCAITRHDLALVDGVPHLVR